MEMEEKDDLQNLHSVGNFLAMNLWIKLGSGLSLLQPLDIHLSQTKQRLAELLFRVGWHRGAYGGSYEYLVNQHWERCEDHWEPG